jgi:hypothetical protein
VRLLAFLLGGAVLLAGCGTTEFVPGETTQPRSTFTPDEQLDPPADVPDPTEVTIPKIGAHSTLIPLGLTSDGALDVPPVDTPAQAAWYAGKQPDVDGDEYEPGSPDGPAILSGHVDGTGPNGQHGYPGVFAKLGELVAGDQILIDREDGSQLTFVVTAVERYSKDALPWDRIMAPTEKPSLRAITCGGEFDPAARHYVDNVVVFADLAADQL